jgi:hypothetical protein
MALIEEISDFDSERFKCGGWIRRCLNNSEIVSNIFWLTSRYSMSRRGIIFDEWDRRRFLFTVNFG